MCTKKKPINQPNNLVEYFIILFKLNLNMKSKLFLTTKPLNQQYIINYTRNMPNSVKKHFDLFRLKGFCFVNLIDFPFHCNS